MGAHGWVAGICQPYFFKNTAQVENIMTTRWSKIESQAGARRATMSVDHLWCAAVVKIAYVICTMLIAAYFKDIT